MKVTPMAENDYRGGAAPALAAHSKDASTPGQTPASSAKPSPQPGGAEPDVMGKLSDAANDAIRTVNDTATKMKDAASEYGGRAAEQASDYVQKQPLFALAVTGIACLMIGAILGRR